MERYHIETVINALIFIMVCSSSGSGRFPFPGADRSSNLLHTTYRGMEKWSISRGS